MTMPPRIVLLVTEKPYCGNPIGAAWSSFFPNDRVIHYFTPPMGSFRVPAARSVSISEGPRCEEVVLEYRPFAHKVSDNSRAGYGDMARNFARADVIVCATDVDPQGARNFMDLLDFYRVQRHPEDIVWLDSMTIVPADIERSIRAMKSISDERFLRHLAEGRARQYFSHNYAINAAEVFGCCLDAVGAPQDQRFVSKYSLQMLFLLSSHLHRRMTESDIFRMMSAGTCDPALGKSPIGSAISRGMILEFLQNAELIEQKGVSGPKDRPVFGLSARGAQLVGMIHPSFEDDQLSLKMDAWAETWPASKEAMSEYLLSRFGKQRDLMAEKALL